MRMRDNPAVVGRSESFFVINPLMIEIDPAYNVRNLNEKEEQDALSELTESIKTSGVRVPLKVRLVGDKVILVQGHRRLAAVRTLIDTGLQIKGVPCVLEDRIMNEAERVLDLRLSNDGKPLSPLANAEIVRRLTNFGWSVADIASRFGCTVQTIYNYQNLLAAPEAIKQDVRDGIVKASTAIQLVKDLGAEGATEAIKEASEKQQNKLEAMVEEAKAKGKTVKSPKAKTISVEVAKKTGAAKKAGTPEPKKVGEPVPAHKLPDRCLKQALEALAFIARHKKEDLTLELAHGMLDEAQVFFDQNKISAEYY